MYAVIKTGGKQYKVSEGQTIKVETLAGEPGAAVEFNEVLMVVEGESVQIGAPFLAKAAVAGEVVSHGRGKKVKIIKFKRRKHQLKRMGHRQNYTEVKITGIKAA